MVDTIKFSEFADGGDLEPDQTTVGLDNTDTVNTRFSNPFPLLPPGTTGDRPAPAANMYYRLRFNTTTELYEYYSPTVPGWIQIEAGIDILPLLASHAAGEGASLIGLQNQGGVLNKFVQDLANAPLISQTDNGTLFNGVFLSALSTGIVSVTTGTGALVGRTLTGFVNQIDIANGDGSANPTFSLSSTLNLPGTFTIQSSTAVDEIINDDTMVTASATNLATALSIKTYVDNSIGSGAGGVNGNIQYNNAGIFGGDANFNTNGAGLITITGQLNVDNLRLDGNVLSSTNTDGNVDVQPNGTGLFQINTTQGVNAIINDNTLATATANNLASALALKTYIDAQTSGLTFLTAVTAASAVAYNATYNNGASGVGATLTNAGALAALSVDGYTPSVGERLLIKDQASTSQNGIYTVTVVGNGAVPWVITRATDYDQPAEILPGQVVPVLIAGATNSGTSWLQTNPVVTIGTDPIQFIQYTVQYPVSLANGGTGTNLTASNGGIVYSNASTLAILAGTATANLPLLSGSSTTPSWSAFALNLGGALTTAGAHTLSGAFASTFTFTNTTTVTFPTTGTLATTAQIPTGAALTKADDTNVTLTLGGSPSTALVNAASLTLGWTGQLAVPRGGSGLASATAYAVLCGGTTSTGAFQSIASVGTSGQVLTSNGAGLLPTFQNSTATPGGSTTQLQYNNAGAFGGDSGSTTDGAGGLTLASVNFTNFATGGVKGTATNNSAAAGYLGELITSQINSGSGVSLSNATAANVTSISLTAGDWDVWGNVSILATGATTIFYGWSSNTSATLPNAALYSDVAGSAGSIGFSIPSRRVSLSGTTTVYLSCRADFTTGTCSGSGGIFARRAR